MAKLVAPEHPSIQTLLGSMDAEMLNIAKQVHRRESTVALIVLPTDSWKSASENSARNLPIIWPGLTYKVKLGQ